MAYIGTYHSPLGNLLLAADDTGLTGLWFEGQKYFARTLPEEQLLKETPVLAETRHWLNIYFSGIDAGSNQELIAKSPLILLFKSWFQPA